MAFRWRGLPEFDKGLKEAQKRFHVAVRAGVTQTTAEVQGRSQKYAPVDEGTLRASHSYFVDGKFIAEAPPDTRGRRPANRSGGIETRRRTGQIRGVVGANVPYAAVQHEAESYRHPKGGRAKFLEQALREVLPRVQNVIQKHVRRGGF